ncbi:HPr kinase/phosphorylase [Neorhizobium lilium]|uniref:HPr kinase/phosphorylase n=1 Tax=Neorhizobium lilium TaxID=2503024 RepID=A0A3S3VHF0_9HYPH|nr:HPr kinase/phosphorylase [Neorhizobium lilium]RWX74603.1 HPr kinase/phosphorylase [Neorhizobium lilium]
MSDAEVNIHGTAIVAGRRGLLFVGPSGSGKSAIAFACLAQARRSGAFAALIADDRVLISRREDKLVARCPEAITGLIELRGSGIVRVESVPTATLHLAIQVISLPEEDRLPPENESYAIGRLGSLPLVRLWNGVRDPLAYLGALYPLLQQERPFSMLDPQILT